LKMHRVTGGIMILFSSTIIGCSVLLLRRLVQLNSF
jgi:hypothetical protein